MRWIRLSLPPLAIGLMACSEGDRTGPVATAQTNQPMQIAIHDENADVDATAPTTPTSHQPSQAQSPGSDEYQLLDIKDLDLGTVARTHM